MNDAQPASGRWRWVTAVGALCVALLAAEGICRLALPRPGFIPLSGSWFPGAVIPHRTRLYQIAPNLNVMITHGTFGDMALRTNADGLRERPLDSLARAPLRILAVGNSFTFGTGIAQEEAWPHQLELKLRQRLRVPADPVVINAGVPAYGLSQIRDLTEELLPRLSPQILLLGVFAGGFDRMHDPFTVLHDFVIRRSQRDNARVVRGGLVLSGFVNPRARDIDLWLLTHTYLGAYLFETINRWRGRLATHRESGTRAASGETAAAQQTMEHADSVNALRAGLAEIKRIADDARARHVTLFVLLAAGFDPHNRIFPDQAAAGRAVQAFCDSLKIPYLDPTERLESSGAPLRIKPTDQHLSAAANVVFADYLADALLRDQRSRPRLFTYSAAR